MKEPIQSLEFYVPIRLYSEANMSEHWRKRNERKLAQQLEMHVSLTNVLAGHKIKLPCKVRMVRIGPKLLDKDNLAGSFKAVQDSIARTLGVDDGDRSKIDWEYDQVAIRERRYNLKIQITSA